MFRLNHADGMEDGRDNDNTEREGAGDCHGVDAFSQCFGGIAEHTIIHGLINAVSRYEWNQSNGEKNTGRCVVNTCTAL